jgi:hypothetical protein
MIKKKTKCSTCKRRPCPQIAPSSGIGPVKAVYLGYQDLTAYGTLGATITKAIDFGFNLIVLAFWINPDIGVDPFSAADLWTRLSDQERQDTLTYANGRNAKIILSAGGSSFVGYEVKGTMSGTNYGTAAATFAQQYSLHGLDFDMENFISPGFTTPSGMTRVQTIQWLTDATFAARAVLGSSALITHAPQAPYFQALEFAQGYLDFYLQTPTPPLDLFIIQYYNQGATYLDYTSQMINNDNYHPGTAVGQLIERGIPASMIVVGKLTQKKDGDSSSWVSPEEIATWVAPALKDLDWNTGFSTWQWNTSGNPTSQFWINTIYP